MTAGTLLPDEPTPIHLHEVVAPEDLAVGFDGQCVKCALAIGQVHNEAGRVLGYAS